MKCEKCGYDFKDGDEFCSRCGQKRPANVALCTSCKHTLSTEDEFCSKCGSRVANQKEVFCRFCGIGIMSTAEYCVKCGGSQREVGEHIDYLCDGEVDVFEPVANSPTDSNTDLVENIYASKDVQQKTPKKRMATVLVISIIIAVIGGLNVFAFTQYKEAEEVARKREEALAHPYHIEHADPNMISNNSIEPIFVYTPSSHRGGEDVNTVNFANGPSSTTRYFQHKYANTQEHQYLPGSNREIYLLLNINMIRAEDMEAYWPENTSIRDDVRGRFDSALGIRTVYWGS